MRRLVLRLALAVALVGAGLQAHAADVIEARDVRFERSLADDSWMLWARFSLPVDTRVEHLVRDGVTLYYEVEFDLTRPRRWWWDETVVQARETRALSWHVLTDQYRVQAGDHTRSYATLAQAVEAITQVAGWRVVPSEHLEPNTRYEARLRMRLDLERLPRHYQLGSTVSNWDISSPWTRFTLTTAIPASAR